MKILQANKSFWAQLAALAIEVVNVFVHKKYKKTKIALEIATKSPIDENDER
jgi:hypothetical protein